MVVWGEGERGREGVAFLPPTASLYLPHKPCVLLPCCSPARSHFVWRITLVSCSWLTLTGEERKEGSEMDVSQNDGAGVCTE